MSRTVVPGSFFLQGGLQGTVDQISSAAASFQHVSVQLRWMLDPSFGLPRTPFTVWVLPGQVGLVNAAGAPSHLAGQVQTFTVPPSYRVKLDLTLTAPGATVAAFNQGKQLVQTGSYTGSGSTTLQLDGTGITSVSILANGNLDNAQCAPHQSVADDARWLPIETVGLPLKNPGPFVSAGYLGATQGMASAPVSAYAAAGRRLLSGAPLKGWPGTLPSGASAPAYVAPWSPQNPTGLLDEHNQKLLPSLLQLLQGSKSPVSDAAIGVTPPVKDPSSQGATPSSGSSTAKVRPTQLLAIAGAADAWNALALGYGTAYNLDEVNAIVAAAHKTSQLRDISGFMVTCDLLVQSMPILAPQPMTFAAVVLTNGQIPGLPAASGMVAKVTGVFPPQQRDLPFTQNVTLAWQREALVFAQQSAIASYAIARSAPATAAPALLNQTHQNGAAVAWVPSHATDDQSGLIFFNDAAIPNAQPKELVRYHVAGQDWFGNWSPWGSTDVALSDEPGNVPALSDPKWNLPPVNAAALSSSLSFLVAWNWTLRTPKQINFGVHLQRLDGPNAPFPSNGFTGTVQMSLTDVIGSSVSLSFDQWGAPHLNGNSGTVTVEVPQPAPSPTSPDVRLYRVVLNGLQLDFAGKPQIVAQIWASATTNFGNGGQTAQPLNAVAMSSAPPPVPKPQSIAWASLPDTSGISRVHLCWPPSPPARYIVYEANETRLLSLAEDTDALGSLQPSNPNPDLSRSFADRLADLHKLDWSKLRRAFHRVTPEPLLHEEFEYELPAGSAVLHLFAVTAISDNNVESAFPSLADGCTASAIPFVRRPLTPRITALPNTKAPGTAVIRVEQRGTLDPAGYELYATRRKDLAADIGTMGPRLATAPTLTATAASATAVAEFHISGIAGSWKPVWYRAVATAADNLAPSPADPTTWGAVGGRSIPTEAVPLLVPPYTAPSAPVVAAAPIGAGSIVVFVTSDVVPERTPLGSHTLTFQLFYQGRLQARTLSFLAETAQPHAAQDAALDTLTRQPGSNGTTVYALHISNAWEGHAFDHAAVTVTDPLNRRST